MSKTQALIVLQGKNHPSALKNLTGAFANLPVQVIEIHFQELYENICLYCSLELEQPDVFLDLERSVHRMASELDLKVSFHTHLPPDDTSCAENRYILTLLSEKFSNQALHHLFSYLEQKTIRVSGIRPLDHEDLHVFELSFCTPETIHRQQFLAELLSFKNQYRIDLALQPDTLFRKNKRLIVFDADMTFIQCEVINELSKLAGKQKEVEEITHRAMNGELDFKQALRERVGMLKGLSVLDLHHIADHIPITPGVEELVKILKMLGYKIGLVSGGFTFFIEKIQKRFQLDYGFANTLEMVDGKLTGKVIGEIIDAERKGSLLTEIAQRESLTTEQIIAVGDGANDLYMIAAAGLGIAFNAKEFLQERATGSLSRPNLDALLYFLGISRQERKSVMGK